MESAATMLHKGAAEVLQDTVLTVASKRTRAVDWDRKNDEEFQARSMLVQKLVVTLGACASTPLACSQAFTVVSLASTLGLRELALSVVRTPSTSSNSLRSCLLCSSCFLTSEMLRGVREVVLGCCVACRGKASGEVDGTGSIALFQLTAAPRHKPHAESAVQTASVVRFILSEDSICVMQLEHDNQTKRFVCSSCRRGMLTRMCSIHASFKISACVQEQKAAKLRSASTSLSIQR